MVLRCTSGAALGPWRAADGAQLAATVQASPAAAGVVAGRRWRGGHPDEMGAEEVTRCQAFRRRGLPSRTLRLSGQPADY